MTLALPQDELWALVPGNPYGYYMLLRWVCCGVFAYLAVQAYESNRRGLVWVLGIVAGIYNPIMPVHLTREIWVVVNVASVTVAVASFLSSNWEMNTDRTQHQHSQQSRTS